MPRWEEQVTNECSHEPHSDSHTVTVAGMCCRQNPTDFPHSFRPQASLSSALTLYPTYTFCSHKVTLLPHNTSTLSYSSLVDTQAPLVSLHCEVPIISDVLH